MQSRRSFILDLISENKSFDEIVRLTHKKYPQENYKQKHEHALSSILWETGRTVPRLEKKTKSAQPKQTKSISLNARSVIVDYTEIEKLRRELEKRREVLVKLAHNPQTGLDGTDRQNIIKFLENGSLPDKPTDEIHLIKEFISSCLSINQPPHRIRLRLTAILGKIPLADSIPICLDKLFGCPDFLVDSNWGPSDLVVLVQCLRDQKENLSDKFKSDILDTIESVAKKMSFELEEGINRFYNRIDFQIEKGPEDVWSFLEKFTANLRGVGPSLMSDFLKNIGFVEFVKIDQRLKKELPRLIKGIKPTPKNMFLFSWNLCAKLKMTPFLFDHILYQWGNPRIKTHLP